MNESSTGGSCSCSESCVRPDRMVQVLAQELNKKEDPKQLTFKAKFFPESVIDELTNPVVQRLVIYLHSSCYSYWDMLL